MNKIINYFTASSIYSFTPCVQFIPGNINLIPYTTYTAPAINNINLYNIVCQLLHIAYITITLLKAAYKMKRITNNTTLTISVLDRTYIVVRNII